MLKRLLLALAIVLVANLWLLWPSIAGAGLLGSLVVLVYLPKFHQKAEDAILTQPPTGGYRSKAQEEAAIAANKHAKENLNIAFDGIRQVVIGAAIGFSFISFAEVYLSLCSTHIGLPLGERAAGQACFGESTLLWLLMLARHIKDPLGHYGDIALVVLIYCVLVVGIFGLRFFTRRVIRPAIRVFELFENVITIAATAVVVAGLFSFWPVLEGSRAELTRVVAAVRLGEELIRGNDRYYSALEHEDAIGRHLIKLLKREELSKPETEQADDIQKLIDNIYEAIARGAGFANSKLDAVRAKRVIEEMKGGLGQAAPRPTPPRPVCGDPSYLCREDVRRITDADRVLRQEQTRAGQQAAAAVKLKAEVELPLEAAIRIFLANRHGRDLDDEAARFTAAIVLTMIVSGADEENVSSLLRQAGIRAEERSTSGQAQVALMVCGDLYDALGEFLRTDRGKELFDRVRADPGGFGLRNPAEAGTGLGISPDQKFRPVNDYIVMLSDGPLRNALFRSLPADMLERARLTISDSAAPIFSAMLRAACYQTLSPQEFTERLNRLSRPI